MIPVLIMVGIGVGFLAVWQQILKAHDAERVQERDRRTIKRELNDIRLNRPHHIIDNEGKD